MTARVAVVGTGRMGRAVASAARAKGYDVTAELGPGELARERLAGAQVVLEFTVPDAAAANLVALAGWGIPTVSGTTGWLERLPEVRAAVERAGAALVHSPNFAVGVHLFVRLARAAGALLAPRPEFDAYLLEVHHRDKRDAPSGTARLLRETLRQADGSRDYAVTSIRAGDVTGTHEIRFEGAGEGIALRHEARDRTVFAHGALLAAAWLLERPRTGVFSFEDVLFGGEPR